ncbi:hypothetical protein HBI60_060020 [Parastagonospora nodorum]|nr:hypothetical protein HBI60_060020 [Parastagonospora nodorum]
MHDPFPLKPPTGLIPYAQKLADRLSLQTLPLHFHEVIVAYSIYHATNKYISPILSRAFFPRTYNALNARTKLNWDVHVVSFVQSVVICTLALWVMWADTERTEMDTTERVHGYTGASGLIQAFAGGYFLWDLVITVQNVRIFGVGMLFHAISALCVFSLGFRPFVNFYAPTFILYELSSPFLNIHWFCDKLNMTGSTLQFLNGIVLLLTFFSCRLVWGTYNSIRVFADVWRAYTAGPLDLSTDRQAALKTAHISGTGDSVLYFAHGQTVPLWLAGAYLASNLCLNGLNWFWFAKMIETLRKRFDPPLGTRRADDKDGAVAVEQEKVLVEGTSVLTPAAVPADSADYLRAGEKVEVKSTGKHLEVGARTRRRG